jgi:hypothetical protein
MFAMLSGFLGYLTGKFADDNLPSFTIKKEAAFRVWNYIFPILTNLFFAAFFVLGILGIQYLVISSRQFFQQLSFALVILLALFFIHSLARSKNPKQQMQALALSIIVMLMIGFHTNRIPLQEVKSE